MLREEVTEADIADIISKWTGIPVTKLVATERQKLLHLSDELHRRVIGQDEAVEAVADAVQRYVACFAGQSASHVHQLFLLWYDARCKYSRQKHSRVASACKLGDWTFAIVCTLLAEAIMSGSSCV